MEQPEISWSSIVALGVISFLVILSVVIGCFILKKKTKRGRRKHVSEKTELNTKTSEEDYEEEITMIPSWLKNKENMIFHPNCIKRDTLLGTGNYGSVYKGKLLQGNAV